MGAEYDQKFEEMKKYIPFLDGMIKRLEANSKVTGNPRQAQLDKIKSLRDLLSVKKKRMKMENLHKCEQVLVNLYAKVESQCLGQDPGFSIDPPTPQEKSELEAVRNKLKNMSKRQEDEETLPEILRVDEVEEIHTAGSKEPALFQRRPNKMSISPTHRSPAKIKEDKTSPPSSASKRNYTRVLVSPDSSRRRWSTSDSAEEKPLFCRRSPRRSPRRHSPAYYKKERKKTLKDSSRKSKGVNITLNVPEHSLTSLNTKDIFHRIIDCKDGDVDIDTLRELRKQILCELRKTGKKDDISDLILKSCNKTTNRLKNKGNNEIEEGELSDSESEIIESLYGNLSGNLILKDQVEDKTSDVKDKNRKIQICLVINSDDSNSDRNTNIKLINNSDVSELEMYNKESKALNTPGSSKEKHEQDTIKIDNVDESITTISDCKKNKEDCYKDKEKSKNDGLDEIQQPSEDEKKKTAPEEPVKYRANFYKSLTDEPVEENLIQDSNEAVHAQVNTQKETDIKTDLSTESTVCEVPKTSKGACLIEAELEKMEKPVEIPLLNEPTIPGTSTNSMLSEIDILQALKNEILSESTTILGSETSTPLLHQPKVNKVASAKEILPKRRITIENYKQKTDREKIMGSIKFYLGNNQSKDDLIKKPSLKLTEKECERFNIQKKISIDDDSSVSDDGGDIQPSDLYGDLAPKSPDCDESSNMELSSPVIIPGDSAKSVPVNRNLDVDMRALPILSPKQNNAPLLSTVELSLPNTNTTSATKTDQIKSQNRPVLFDPRVRRDVSSSQSPSPHTVHPDRTPRSSFSSVNQSPASNAVMTPNARSYDMTYNHQSFDVDKSNKHVYVPSFSMFDSKEKENSMAKDSNKNAPREGRKSRFEDIGDTSSWSSSDASINTRNTDSFNGDKYSKRRNDRYNLDNRDCFSYKRSECPRTPLPSFGRSDVPATSSQASSRLDNPMTPLHSFGRAECPATPSHHFGRAECPPTPIHSFGRSDCPSTPNNSFGSLSFNECPLTPSHQFGECPPTPYYGRNDCPPTPNPGFGRSDCPSTPNHPFGRSDFNKTHTQNYVKDPRLNRKPEYESNSQLNERDRGYYKDSGYHRGSSYKSQKPFSASDTYRSQDREQGRNSKYRYYAPEQTGRQFSKEPPRREQMVGSFIPNDNENDRPFSKQRGQYNSVYDEVALRRSNQRERSIGRTIHSEDKPETGVGRHNRVEDAFSRSSSRGASIRSSIEPESKSISVKFDAGGSFKIDTSVNETFQKFLESGNKGIQIFEYNFDTRRQRAASVGRSLVRESHCEQISDGSKANSEILNKKEVFRRASSMGRDLTDSSAKERSFQEIKADFKTYRHPVKELGKFDTGKIRHIDTKAKINTENTVRSRRERESYEKYKEEKRAQSNSKLAYSPRMNYRDPRMRREMKMKNKYEDPRTRKSGIIYSNDNIVKGAILASGYGVKNYKIPKIKRVVEEKEAEKATKEEHINKKDEKEKDKIKNIEKSKEGPVKEKANDKNKDRKATPNPRTKDTLKERSNESHQLKSKEISKGKIKEIIKESDTISDSETEKVQIHNDDTSDTDDQIGRRSLRLSRRLAVKNIVKNAQTKKSKKSIISDSDSETDNSVTEKLPKVIHETNLRTTKSAPPPQGTSVVNEKLITKQPNSIDMHSNFGLELEMFSDNVASDPVIDNINALIADLDNDLDASKNGSSNNFTNEITLENMMQNITSPQNNSRESRDDFTNLLKSVDELSKTTDNKMHENSLSDLNKVNSDIAAMNTENTQQLRNTEDCNSNKNTGTQRFENLLAPVENEEVKNKVSESCKTSLDLSTPTNEDIVSTTEIEKDNIPSGNKLQIDERSMDGCSTPDSTIGTHSPGKNKRDDCNVDSTIEETHSEANVTSTDSVEPEPEAESDLQLGNLLTMLQDKSKIKKLLIMLGDQSGDNDKIKKKLEKLSEIVSDDEVEETTQQPEKNKTEVFTDDKKTDANPTVNEEATLETESQSNGEEKTKINKNNEEAFNKDNKETQLNKYDEETQLNKDNEETQLNKDDEETQLNKDDEETQLNKDDEETQFNKNDNTTQLNKEDDATQLNKDCKETQLNKNDEETQLNTNGQGMSLIKNDETRLNNNDKGPTLNKNKKGTRLNDKNTDSPLNKNDEETRLNKNVEGTQLTKIDDETQLNENEGETQLNKKDEGMPWNKNDKEPRLNKYAEEIKLNKSSEDMQLTNGEDRENDDDLDNDGSFEEVIDEDVAKAEEEVQVTKTKYKRKKTGKKSKFSKKGKGRGPKKVTSIAEKRVTRATAAIETKKPKKPPRELQKLHEDIREMFIKDDILSATGIRNCRLAKLVDEKPKDDVLIPEPEPVVLLEKFKSSADKSRDNPIPEKVRKKPGPKPKPKISTDSLDLAKPKYKPGPKSKTKNKKEIDPYAFETESVGETTVEKASEDESDSSDSEVGSLVSSKSFGSTEILSEIKKKKRKRGRWQDGVIKPKNKKKKLEVKAGSSDYILPTEKQIIAPDPNAPFTDKTYCFRKHDLHYPCRLCEFTGSDIVHHYISEHPHVEIPLSRMAPEVANEAIDQCKEINFNDFSKIPSDKYVCIFCYKEFAYNSSVLETFFWHIVSMHTGEYKHSCSECPNEHQCTFRLDIPPPPNETNGQLIGYICKKCNFTQLSLENLKNHVIRRHNDEQTAVYTINLSAMSKTTLKDFLRFTISKPGIPRVLTDRSIKKPNNGAESSEQPPTVKVLLASMKSKITFEADDNVDELLDLTDNDSKIKIERVESENTVEILQDEPQSRDATEISQSAKIDHEPAQHSHEKEQQPNVDVDAGLEDLASRPSNDIIDYPHFKINFTESGAKEYICCINGKDNHFKTTLLISMKKHVQLKHSENWDGYCFICKVIVTPQGAHKFKDCFQHYLDKHLDNFPIYQKEVVPGSAPEKVSDDQAIQTESSASKPYLNVRPINELITAAADDTSKETSNFPIIQSVVSLGAESPQLNPTYPKIRQEPKQTEVSFKYEEVQAKVMLNKHRVVLETMMVRDKLIKVFKCAGRFCSFTSDSAEDALLHASTHQRIGGADALNCSYCDFDAQGNAIDLVMHVFKAHGSCQYSCGQCFYRAAASQSVGAHATRVHEVASSEAIVLRTTVATNTSDGGRMLTREQAVAYYVCHHVESSGKCKFRSYTQDKFCEHLQQKHGGATTHPCYKCQLKVSSPSELIQHMKSHGLMLYQCTWCVLGADNEGELLAHVSTVHPTKPPQAYLRIITTKDGSNDLRVLPLAFLNKMKVPTIDVTPSTTKENPVREAERSIDLEKLISLTIMMEPQLDMSAPTLEEQPQDMIPEVVKELVAPTAPVATTAAIIPVVPTVRAADQKMGDLSPISKPVASISASCLTDDTNRSAVVDTTVTSVTTTRKPPLTITRVGIKTENETPMSTPGDVVVLDSDDEDPRQPIIDLSDEDTSSNKQAPAQGVNQKVPMEILSTCPKCQQICKSINGLKKHFFYCYPDKDAGCKCAHCPYMASSRDNIMHHYLNDHCDRDVYMCGVCRSSLVNLTLVKRHLKYVHKEKDFVITSTTENGISYYTVNVAKKEKRELPKRKLSVSTTETINKRRFWPQEINQLPINPILDQLVYCEICEFSTKVRLNMVRHLQLHAEQQPVAQTAPVNPVPHLETNEMHFDRMVNLASSSLQPRDRPGPAAGSLPTPAAGPAALPVPRELAARYPQQISARARNTCGAVGCTYTSVDEPMLKRHWEALHSGPASFNFRCVHCPDNQTTDTSKPITANRVVQHLKMHDDTLYACSKCHLYHYKRDFIEKHMMEVHQNAPLYIVRESAGAAAAAAAATASASTAATPSAAPTMDLKPWQCGFCKFKSMLRPEVTEHCFKLHQSKMQFRCGYCPYRASALENVNNHLAHSHANEPEDVIYYYYREGSLPDEADGTPRWMKQRHKMGSNLPVVKTEVQETLTQAPSVPPPPVNIDLKLVKQEVDETVPESVESMGDLCRRFGQFCEPDGIKFKCPLCRVITEETREAMQSHLYEELQYRKWGCGLCNYKAFHKAGLTEHMSIEHFRQYEHIELPKDVNKEKWVTGQLDHQASIIDKHKSNLAKQKITVEKLTKPVSSTVSSSAPPTVDAVEKFSMAQLEQAFGHFGEPSDTMYCCPFQCDFLTADELVMRNHLETELNKIRWGCTNCSVKYQTYHEAQFHSKGHDGPSKPLEAIRDPSMRAAWVNNCIQLQKKKILQCASVKPTTAESENSFTETDNNSLLVVRYEERVPTPDLVPASRKRAAPDSDDERLVIDEPGPKKKVLRPCPHCPYKSKVYNSWREHVLKHYNLKPYTCCYCDYSCCYPQRLIAHTEKTHPGQTLSIKMTGIPPAESYTLSPKKKLVAEEETNVPKIICLFCENSIPETEIDNHLHDNIKPDFAKKGDVVVKCCICLVLRLDVKSLQEHYNLAHPHAPVNYALFKLHHNTRETHLCGYCEDVGFKFLRDLKTHHNAVHPTLLFKYTTVPYLTADGNRESRKKDEPQRLKGCARKSTTKLPGSKAVAKKSTTKLPYSIPSTSDEGYSYYKTKPESLENYANVTTLMSFCQRMVPFTLKKLSEIINIEPTVVVKDIRAGDSSDNMTL